MCDIAVTSSEEQIKIKKLKTSFQNAVDALSPGQYKVRVFLMSEPKTPKEKPSRRSSFGHVDSVAKTNKTAKSSQDQDQQDQNQDQQDHPSPICETFEEVIRRKYREDPEKYRGRYFRLFPVLTVKQEQLLWRGRQLEEYYARRPKPIPNEQGEFDDFDKLAIPLRDLEKMELGRKIAATLCNKQLQAEQYKIEATAKYQAFEARKNKRPEVAKPKLEATRDSIIEPECTFEKPEYSEADHEIRMKREATKKDDALPILKRYIPKAHRTVEPVIDNMDCINLPSVEIENSQTMMPSKDNLNQSSDSINTTIIVPPKACLKQPSKGVEHVIADEPELQTLAIVKPIRVREIITKPSKTDVELVTQSLESCVIPPAQFERKLVQSIGNTTERVPLSPRSLFRKYGMDPNRYDEHGNLKNNHKKVSASPPKPTETLPDIWSQEERLHKPADCTKVVEQIPDVPKPSTAKIAEVKVKKSEIKKSESEDDWPESKMFDKHGMHTTAYKKHLAKLRKQEEKLAKQQDEIARKKDPIWHRSSVRSLFSR
jgi:hypothetical protein